MNIKVWIRNQQKELRHKPGRSVLQTLQDAGLLQDAPCGGNGRCGKCRIQFLSGRTEASEADKNILSEEERNRGIRLACTAFPQNDCSIMLEAAHDGMEILAEYREQGRTEVTEKTGITGTGIAVDIGTTTIAMQLIALPEGKAVKSYTAQNSQRKYGADVISRIQASNRGNKQELKELIREDLRRGITVLLEDGGQQPEIMVISANTTMIHLLMGYSCETLGVFPFQPVNMDTILIPYEELFGECTYSMRIMILPSLSAFVGGDIMAGLLICGFWNRKEISVLIDLGTNGELAVGNCDRILVTSTAAGPAFEGGNISQGVGSVPGAICHVEITKDGAVAETIGGQEPCGICGTGVVETVYELLKNGMIDETGLLQKPLFETGVLLAELPDGETIRLTQKDIREIQLAKAAIHAGIRTLMLRYGTTWEEIGTVYLAGGFGYRMNLQKAAGIGLLPKELEEKVIVMGNTALAGSCYYMTEKNADKQAASVKAAAQEINLSLDTSFQEYYMEEMYFQPALEK